MQGHDSVNWSEQDLTQAALSRIDPATKMDIAVRPRTLGQRGLVE